jgi:hypothetical protein
MSKAAKPSYEFRYRTEPDFRKGYDAAAIYEDFDKMAPEAWKDGWNAYQDDMDACDQRSW